MGDVLKFLQNGSPETLFTNALAEAGEVEYAIIVMMRKDGKIRTDWSAIPSGIAALGAVDILHRAILQELQ